MPTAPDPMQIRRADSPRAASAGESTKEVSDCARNVRELATKDWSTEEKEPGDALPTLAQWPRPRNARQRRQCKYQCRSAGKADKTQRRGLLQIQRSVRQGLWNGGVRRAEDR